jgi:glycosyltransferase involved in cell wall biosynthesis
MKRGLDRLGIPYRHIYYRDYRDIAQLYQALDAYIISSRDEGGPKSVLESMASGIPLITTRVGQAADLVRHGINGFMVEQEDAEGLARWTEHTFSLSPDERASLIDASRKTAKEHSYDAQIPLWRSFFHGYVMQ